MPHIDDVISYIFNTDITNTTIGKKLKTAAIEKAKPNLNNIQKKDHEYNMSIHSIRNFDSEGNICWIDYKSWVTLPKVLQKSIITYLDPKSWKGVIFRYNLWEENEKNIVRNMHKDIILILTRDANKKYRIYTIPLYKSYLDWITPTKFDELNIKISSNAIKTYGRVDNMIFILNNKSNDLEEFCIESAKLS